jgi:hypothetical protein
MNGPAEIAAALAGLDGIVRMRDVEEILAPGHGYDQGRIS